MEISEEEFLNFIATENEDKIKTYITYFEKSHIFRKGCTMLSYAVRLGCYNIINFFLQNGNDVKEREPGGATPLLLAIQKQYFEIVQLLIDKGADINKGDSLYSPLTLAVQVNNKEIVELLIESGADITATFLNGCPLTTAIENYAELDIIELLIQNMNDDFICPVEYLNYAIKCGNLEAIRLLLENWDYSVNQIDKNVDSPLMIAVENGEIEIVEILLEEEADLFPKKKSINQATRMMNRLLNKGAEITILAVIETAAIAGNVDILQLLIKRANLNCQDSIIKSVFKTAFNYQIVPILNYLIEIGIKLTDEIDEIQLNELFNNSLNEILHDDEYIMHLMLEFLVKNGVDIDQTLSDGTTALTTTINERELKWVKFLHNLGADVNKTDENGNSPLALAHENESFEILLFLIESGATLNKKDQEDEELVKCYEITKKRVVKIERCRFRFSPIRC